MKKPAFRALSACAAVFVSACSTQDDVPPSAAAQRRAASALESEVPTYFETVHGVGLDDISWGDMHTHTYYSQDAAAQQGLPGSPDEATPATVYALARQRGFRFAAVADHAEAPAPGGIPDADGSANVWESTRKMSQDANDEVADANGVFIPFMGHEYTNPFPCVDDTPGDGVQECPGDCTSLGGDESCTAHGHKNVVFRSLSGAPAKRASFLDPASWTATGVDCLAPNPSPYCGFSSYAAFTPDNQALWTWLRARGYGSPASGSPTSALTLIHTPGNIHHNDWEVTDREFVRNVEVFSQWGNSEGPAPLHCGGRTDLDVSLPPEAANDEDDLIRPRLRQHWLMEGKESYALSFVGGSDHHGGLPGGTGNGDGAVTGIISPTLSRGAFFDALWKRHTVASTYYASTGPIPLLFAVETGGKHLLGGDVGAIGSDGKVTVRVWAGSQVQEVQLVVDGCTVETRSGAVHQLQLDTLSPSARHFIYVRARRQTGASDAVGDAAASTAYHQAWSSPVYLRPSGT